MAHVSLGQHISNLQQQRHRRRRMEFLLGSFGLLVAVIVVAMFIGFSQQPQETDRDVSMRFEPLKEYQMARRLERDARPSQPKPFSTTVEGNQSGIPKTGTS